MTDIFAETKRPTLAQRDQQVRNAENQVTEAKAGLRRAKQNGTAKDVKFFESWVKACEKQLKSVIDIRDRQKAEG